MAMGNIIFIRQGVRSNQFPWGYGVKLHENPKAAIRVIVHRFLALEPLICSDTLLKNEGRCGTFHLDRATPVGDFSIIALRSSTHLHRYKIIGYFELYFVFKPKYIRWKS